MGSHSQYRASHCGTARMVSLWTARIHNRIPGRRPVFYRTKSHHPKQSLWYRRPEPRRRLRRSDGQIDPGCRCGWNDRHRQLFLRFTNPLAKRWKSHTQRRNNRLALCERISQCHHRSRKRDEYWIIRKPSHYSRTRGNGYLIGSRAKRIGRLALWMQRRRWISQPGSRRSQRRHPHSRKRLHAAAISQHDTRSAKLEPESPHRVQRRLSSHRTTPGRL